MRISRSFHENKPFLLHFITQAYPSSPSALPLRGQVTHARERNYLSFPSIIAIFFDKEPFKLTTEQTETSGIAEYSVLQAEESELYFP